MFNRKKYLQENKEQIKQYKKEYYKCHKDKINRYKHEWYIQHKQEIKLKRRNYMRIKLKININFRLTHYLRHRIYVAIKRLNKSKSTSNLLGCSVEQLKKHLQFKFKQGMSWKNYGQWHIDHIRPCASFDLSKISEQKKCFHYTNLQPLWAKDNLRKHAIFEEN